MKQFLPLFFLTTLSLHAQDTVTVFSYNLLRYTYGDTTRDQYFRTTLGSLNLDIIVTQENTSAEGVDQFKNNVIEKIYPGIYGAADFIDGPDSDNMLYYKKSKFTFLSNKPIHTTLRDINEFTLVHTTSPDTLRIYSVHLKASSGINNETQRSTEVDSLRKITDALPAGTNFIVCGDFNLYHADEAAYQKLLEVKPNSEGHFYDAITMTGIWNDIAYAKYHTQSPRVRSFGGGINGGLDDRFDLILYSTALNDTTKPYIIPNSITTYGNDGNHYNDSINKQPNTAVSPEIADALHYGADHLPVFAKVVFPGKTLQVNSTGLSYKMMKGYSLKPIFPNPANPNTTISFAIPQREQITLKIFSISGMLVQNLADEQKPPGIYYYTFNGSHLASGIYFIEFRAGSFSETKKMVLVK